MYNAVGVDIEGDLDLGDSPRRRGDAHETELSEEFVVRCHFTFALVYLDFDLCLTVSRCEKKMLTLLYIYD